jgi:hypothetical protein
MDLPMKVCDLIHGYAGRYFYRCSFGAPNYAGIWFSLDNF